jgi:hypothetical protein
LTFGKPYKYQRSLKHIDIIVRAWHSKECMANT